LPERLKEDPLAGAELGPGTVNIEPENEALRRELDTMELEDARLTALSSACCVGVRGRASRLATGGSAVDSDDEQSTLLSMLRELSSWK